MGEKKEEKQEVTIIDIRDVPATEPGRIGRLDTLVTYQIDPAHVYIIRIPKEELAEKTEEEQLEIIRAAIKKDVEFRTRWLGRRIAI